MSLFLKFLTVFLAVFQVFQAQLGSASDWTATDLASPTVKAYSKSYWKARSVWDMILVDGVLYAGSGDYGTNAGPVKIWAYDTEAEDWSAAQVVNGEAVSRFISLEDKVVAPGIDPRSDWEYGDYYTLADGQWSVMDKLPYAVHNFDIASFEGKLFFGLGTEDDGTCPILMSENGTDSFTQVPLYKNDAPVLGTGAYSFTRVYDFFVLEDQLYCLFAPYREDAGYSYEFYRFDGDRFVYIPRDEKNMITVRAIKQVPIAGKAYANNACYIAAGTLYQTTDFQTFTQVQLPCEGLVTDLLAEPLGDTGLEVVYALASAKTEDGSYLSTIYAIAPDGSVLPVAQHEATCLALSFVKEGKGFYVGFGSGDEVSADVGKVIYLTK